MSSCLSNDHVDAALNECKEPGTFKATKFFQTSGISKLPVTKIKELFQMLDTNGDGSLDKDDIIDFLQKFRKSARVLTEDEVRDFFAAGDPDGDGKIGANEFQDMVQKSAME